MPRTRAERRAHRKRIYRKWRAIAHQRDITDDNTRNGLHEWIMRTMEDMPICSDPGCCGNPRKRGHKTRQEIRAELDGIDKNENIDD